MTLAAVSVFVSLGTALYIARSGPITTRQVLEDLFKAVRETRGGLEDLSLKWVSYREGVDAVLEEIEATSERVERKRRSAAQAAARADRKENAGAPMTPEEERRMLRERARALGIPV